MHQKILLVGCDKMCCSLRNESMRGFLLMHNSLQLPKLYSYLGVCIGQQMENIASKLVIQFLSFKIDFAEPIVLIESFIRVYEGTLDENAGKLSVRLSCMVFGNCFARVKKLQK